MIRILFFLLCFALPAAATAQTLRFLTYNIRYDNPGDGDDAWPKRRDYLAAQIGFYAPDVFGIQEGLHHQVEFLAQQLPQYAWVGAGRDDGRQAGEYSALFYRRDRFRLLDSGTFWLSETPGQPSKGWDAALNRVCTYALLRDSVTGQQLWVFNTHFDHIGQEARRQSAALIIQKIREKNPENKPVVVMGDFNAEPSEAPVATMKNALTDTQEASETPAFGPSGTFNGFKFHEPVTRRIDYIFTGGTGLRVLRHAVLSDSKDCHYPSDHLPVMADIAF
ncbi:MAG: endonuclease/exonuclease/phosphatase family protein [Saprospiraceae bacterium]|nr:endonuclease/exonuclease/phosphatase family protein [Saprospiraceae bacterium]